MTEPFSPESRVAGIVLAALLEARTGQAPRVNRPGWARTALGPLLAELGLCGVDELVARVLGGSDPVIADRVVDALLNQETSFFRDGGVLEAAAGALGAIGAVGGRARVWCAACASGQEPLSLAMIFAEAGDRMPEILATDVSPGALARARTGVYSHFEIQRGLSVRRMMRWFARDEVSNGWTASRALSRTIMWRRHNIVSEPPPGRFDLVTCRNVLFYLSEAARDRALANLAMAVRPGGLLLLGAGETIIGRSAAFRPSPRHRGLYERLDDACARQRVA